MNGDSCGEVLRKEHQRVLLFSARSLSVFLAFPTPLGAIGEASDPPRMSCTEMPATTRAAASATKASIHSLHSVPRTDSCQAQEPSYDADVELPSESDEEAAADFIKVFAGRSKREILNGGRFNWTEHKTKILKHGLQRYVQLRDVGLGLISNLCVAVATVVEILQL